MMLNADIKLFNCTSIRIPSYIQKNDGNPLFYIPNPNLFLHAPSPSSPSPIPRKKKGGAGKMKVSRQTKSCWPFVHRQVNNCWRWPKKTFNILPTSRTLSSTTIGSAHSWNNYGQMAVPNNNATWSKIPKSECSLNCTFYRYGYFCTYRAVYSAGSMLTARSILTFIIGQNVICICKLGHDVGDTATQVFV